MIQDRDRSRRFKFEEVESTNMMKYFVLQFGAPQKLISDRGTAFTPNMFEQYTKKHRIRHVLISSGHPQANVMVERMNRTVLQLLRTCQQRTRRLGQTFAKNRTGPEHVEKGLRQVKLRLR